MEVQIANHENGSQRNTATAVNNQSLWPGAVIKPGRCSIAAACGVSAIFSSAQHCHYPRSPIARAIHVWPRSMTRTPCQRCEKTHCSSTMVTSGDRSHVNSGKPMTTAMIIDAPRDSPTNMRGNGPDVLPERFWPTVVEGNDFGRIESAYNLPCQVIHQPRYSVLRSSRSGSVDCSIAAAPPVHPRSPYTDRETLRRRRHAPQLPGFRMETAVWLPSGERPSNRLLSLSRRRYTLSVFGEYFTVAYSHNAPASVLQPEDQPWTLASGGQQHDLGLNHSAYQPVRNIDDNSGIRRSAQLAWLLPKAFKPLVHP